MKVYKLQGKAKCVFCGESADLYVDGLHIAVCRKCGVNLYKNLGEHFVPRAVPNVMIRNEKQYRPLSIVLDESKVETPMEKAKEKHTKARKTKEFFEKFKNKMKKFSNIFKVKGETNERQSK